MRLVRWVQTLARSPFVAGLTRAGVLILIYGIAGLCMAATVAVITGIGMLRLLQSSIEGGQRVATVSTTAR
jgi:hypothetical protein